MNKIFDCFSYWDEDLLLDLRFHLLNDIVDYLVVADGVFSNTKPVIEKKEIKPVYSGAVAFRTQIKNQDILNFNSKNAFKFHPSSVFGYISGIG